MAARTAISISAGPASEIVPTTSSGFAGLCERIEVVPLYFAKMRPMVVRGGAVIPIEHNMPLLPGEAPQMVMCRMRSLGCTYCTGAVRSTATTVADIIAELRLIKKSERENRVIDHDQEGSMEQKKGEGYF